jgi:hypothetical protein
MRILLQIALIVVFTAMCSAEVMASPAYPGLIEYRQPDGQPSASTLKAMNV